MAVHRTDILNELKNFIKEINIEKKQDLVYLFVLIRKLIEPQHATDNKSIPHERLKFYCDWPLHSILNRKHAETTLTSPHFPDNILDLKELHEELVNFCKPNKLFELEDILQNRWGPFMKTYLLVVSGSPLTIPDWESDYKNYKKYGRLEVNTYGDGENINIRFEWDEH